MKTQKALAVLATASLLGLSVGCNDRYSEGITEGKKQGYSEGYDDGYQAGYVDGDGAGFERARSFFASADYNAGFNDGKTAGIQIGYSQGYSVGKEDGRAEGYSLGYGQGKNDGEAIGHDRGFSRGYDDGYDDGYADGGDGAYSTGFNDGVNVGYNSGYGDGYDDGAADGYDLGYDQGVGDGYDIGYDNGFGDGYDIGYDDGFDDGYGLSVGKSNKLKGYADLLSMAHNDIFDYSKIRAPKQTARGLVVGSQLLLSETSLTNKDTLKRTAVVEQYLVVEMAKQVKGKFGLSAERSLKVAKAANHFRKYSSKRALTSEDTNAYSEEILGANFNDIEKAYTQSLKGDISGLNTVLEKAAEKNGVSPEKMGEIVTKLFI